MRQNKRPRENGAFFVEARRLLDADISGAGFDAHGWAAAVDVSGNVMALKAAVGGDGGIAMD